jgi:hypothetical protein
MEDYKRAFTEVFEQANERLQSVGDGWQVRWRCLDQSGVFHRAHCTTVHAHASVLPATVFSTVGVIWWVIGQQHTVKNGYSNR